MGINRAYLYNFQNKLLGSSSKWVHKYLYSVPAQSEVKGEVRPFWSGKASCGGNVNYYKSVHQPIPARENWEHPGNFQSESISSAFNEFCHFTL